MAKRISTTASSGSENTGVWRRRVLLGFAISLTGAGLVLGFTSDSSSGTFAQGVCLKTGIVTFMWWLALPQLQKLNPFAVGAAGILAIIAIVRPQLLLLLLKVAIPLGPVLFLLWLFWKLKRKH